MISSDRQVARAICAANVRTSCSSTSVEAVWIDSSVIAPS